jgi:U3 small nucleolar RNA-associated protein 21
LNREDTNLHYFLPRKQKRNKPKEPPKIPDSAPFFLPTVSGLDPVFDATGGDKDSEISKKTQSEKRKTRMMDLSPFSEKLLDCASNGDYKIILDLLKEMGPSKIDAELQCLDIPISVDDDDKSLTIEDKPLLLLYFLNAMEEALKSRKDYELVISFLSLFLRTHMEILLKEPFLKKACLRVDSVIQDSWSNIENSFGQNLCIINFLRSFVA